MNEQKNMKMLYLKQKPDPLKEDWDALIQRLYKILKNSVKLSLTKDEFVSIVRKINVLQKNKPSKKIYRSILNFTNEMESRLNVNNRER